MLDEKRFAIPLPTRQKTLALLKVMAESAPGFLLALTEVLGMPSGLHAAYVASLAALERPIHWPLAGVCVAMVLRIISGLDPRWEGVITLGLLLCGPLILPGRGNGLLMAFTAATLMPMAVRGWLAPTAMEMVLCLASVGLSTLCAPVICRGLKALGARGCDGRPLQIDSAEDRIGTAMLGLLIMGGGARLLVAGVNAGMAMGSAGVLLLAVHFGAGTGCAAGIIAGLVLSLTGLPVMLSLALSAGGFLAGVMQTTGRRWLCCGVFAAVALIPMIMTHTAKLGCGAAVVLAACGVLFMPDGMRRRVAGWMQRLRCDDPQAGNAYASSMLAAWEKTVGAMAMSVPVPDRRQPDRDASWWTAKLCEGCAEAGCCPGIRGYAATERLEDIWTYREAEDPIWQGALEGLRGLGCQRLYHLQREMNALRDEDAQQYRHICHAMAQRNMLVTHLAAMAGAARRFAYMSQGENWWDAMMAGRIRRVISDAAMPVRLRWIRKVQGHVQAAFILLDITGVRRQAEELCDLVEGCIGVQMMPSSADGERVYLSECPPLLADCGVASACINGQSVCGDTALHVRLQDGRYMVAVSDGMGHGTDAALASQQTVGLLRLCLDAGYTLQQTVTAVNGMMLLGGCSDCFVTADLLTVDLWTGQAVLIKLGAAGSWLQQGGGLQQMTGDALPMGILENVEGGEYTLRLRPGDALVLMTDGIEEAFSDTDELREAIRLALMEDDPEHAAESLLDAACRAEEGCRSDDQTVVVLRIRERRGHPGKA